MSIRLQAKRALALSVRAVRPLRHVPAARVLTFHEVGRHPWALETDRFRAIVREVARDVAVVPLDEILREDPARRPRAAITFDDGYAGCCAGALPWLAGEGLHATLFVPTGLLRDGPTLPPPEARLYPGLALAGWDEVRRLHATGRVAIGAHGTTHRPLPSLSAEDRRAELEESRRAIRERDLGPARHLAYPLGAWDAATVEDARSVGYEAGFTTRHGGLAPGADPLCLPRLDVRRDYEPRDVVAALRGDWDGLALLHRWRERRAR
jgi:peptidoglycan/xylan/chitin deacetylase (PgdA/CDA1 family)